MTIVNHLTGQEAQNLFLAVAYGKHVVTGHLPKSDVTGASGSHTIKLQQLLGRGEWDGCEGLWWNGLEITAANYKFHPGKQTPAPVLKNFTADNATDTFTSAAHGLANGDIVIFRPGDLPAGLTAGALYYVINSATNTFKVSTTSGGAAVNITSNGTGTLQFYKNDPDQGYDPVFWPDSPHSGVAWIRATLPVGVGEFDTAGTPPLGLSGIFRTTKVNDYDAAGNVTGYSYSTNPARQVADLILRIGGIPASRIDWPAWVAWRDFCDALIPFDYTALPDFDGFGLSGSYYNGTAFNTLAIERVDPVLEVLSTAGSPGIGVNTDNFSARWEGKIKPSHTETYTFYVTHTHGARLYVNNLAVALIDQWGTTGTHSATIALTADQFYDIKLEWQHTTGNAEIRLEWASTSQVREVISHRALYPKTTNRKRYETHPFFSSPTRLDDAVRTVLNLCNSTYQDVDGKLKFFCLEQLTASSFHITDAMINDGTLKAIPRDVRSLRNSWQAKYRDIDSQYLEEPIDPVLIERDELIEAAGRKIDGEAIDLFNCTRHQAYRTLENHVKRTVDSKFSFELDGNADTYEVLAGDRIKIDVEFLNWTEKECLVLDSNDASGEDTADERSFVLQEWTL